MSNMELKNKKVLLMGLGILGGGVATAKWLLKQGAILTVTDLKDEKALEPSLKKLQEFESGIKFVLGKHEEKDFLDNDIIVINPDVPSKNHFVEMARKAGKQIENELTLFYKFAEFKTSIGVTGTRGKTTTTNWIGHILKNSGEKVIVLGNDPEKPFLSEIENCTKETVVVIETPSFQLEIFGESGLAPHLSVITNIYQDHLSRHKTMEEYALAKANIFKNQTEKDFLILNKNNQWTDFLLSLKPRAKVIFFVPEEDSPNLSASVVAAKTMGMSDIEVESAIPTLPSIPWRQEKVYDKGKLKIYNDTAATSPEATILALKHFPEAVFIVGGTDKELDFKEWAKVVNQNLKPENLALLSGSATEKMKKELGWDKFNEFENLEGCMGFALNQIGSEGVIVFSPGAKSFEKFKNEFDRGEKFNAIVNKML
ncbi:MAG TPA: Mur ligase family protein [Candidatus Paceibacterota bacterium]